MATPTARDSAVLTALAHRIDRDDPVILNNFSWLAARGGQGTIALAAARRAVTLEGAPASVWRTLERLAVSRTDGLLLANRQDDAIKRQTTPVASMLSAAVMAHRNASLAVAEACYRSAVAHRSHAAAAWNGLAVLHEQRHENEAADNAWTESFRSQSVAALHNRALSWARRGDPTQASELLDANREIVESSAQLLFLVGYVELLLGDVIPAIESIEAARNLDGTLARAEFALGILYQQSGRHGEALTATRRALLISPLYVPQLWLLHRPGGSLIDLAAADTAQEEPTASDEVFLSLGRSLLEAGHLGEALAVFDQVLVRDETHTGALFHRGVVLAKLRRYQEALQDWDTVADLDQGGLLATESRRHSGSARRLEQLFSVG